MITLVLRFSSISILFLAGCAVGSLRVNSTPDRADVYISYDSEQPTKIGTTPLNLDSRIIDNGRGKYATISVRKEGYQTESVLVPIGFLKSSFDMSSKLEEFKLPLQCQDQTHAVEKIARGIANVQSLVKGNNLAEAQGKLNILIDEYPNVSVLHDLSGNVHYLNKNLEPALNAYEKSLKIDPSNLDTQRMVNKLRSILGVRAPVGAAGGGN